MRRSIFIISATAAFFLGACNNSNEKQTSGQEEEIVAQEPENLEEETKMFDTSCYRYTSSKDTIYIKIENSGDGVTGDLVYNFFEKPKDEGIFKGRVVGDTIFADYNYKSGGSSKVREVVFVKKDSTLVEGYGDTEVAGGKTKFKPNAILTFNEVMSLEKIDCNQE